MKTFKLAAVIAAFLICVFAASTGMAIQVSCRSAEMHAFSVCERAGTIEMKFTAADWNTMANYLDPGGIAAEYVRIRIALNGVNLLPNPSVPILCNPIHGVVDSAGLGAQGGALPVTNLVEIDQIDVEISDNESGGATGTPDLTMYVHGNSADQYIQVFITALEGAVGDYDFGNNPPWFKIGLYYELDLEGGQDYTAICTDVHSFSGISRLTISNDSLPNTLTFSGDNEIGHFVWNPFCPNDPHHDADEDGVCGDVDNCPNDFNPAQEDGDGDGIGDVCDNCPYHSNPGQEDDDGDGIGDACETPIPTDSDNDGLAASEELIRNTNPNDIDTDGDGLNDSEDAYPLDYDADKDGIIDH